jgi:hypothetical protein
MNIKNLPKYLSNMRASPIGQSLHASYPLALGFLSPLADIICNILHIINECLHGRLFSLRLGREVSNWLALAQLVLAPGRAEHPRFQLQVRQMPWLELGGVLQQAASRAAPESHTTSNAVGPRRAVLHFVSFLVAGPSAPVARRPAGGVLLMLMCVLHGRCEKNWKI